MRLRFVFAAVAVAMCGVLAGCDNERAEIKRVATGYLEAVGNYRFDEAEAYVTQATRDTTIAFFKAILPMTDTAYLASATPAEVSIKSIRMTSDSSARVAFEKRSPMGEVSDTVELVRESGRWLVKNVIVVPPMFRMLLNPPSAEDRERMAERLKARRDSVR